MKINCLWVISLVIISAATVILAGGSLMGISLPDWLVRTLGILSLVSLAVLVFTSIKKQTRK